MKTYKRKYVHHQS